MIPQNVKTFIERQPKPFLKWCQFAAVLTAVCGAYAISARPETSIIHPDLYMLPPVCYWIAVIACSAMRARYYKSLFGWASILLAVSTIICIITAFTNRSTPYTYTGAGALSLGILISSGVLWATLTIERKQLEAAENIVETMSEITNGLEESAKQTDGLMKEFKTILKEKNDQNEKKKTSDDQRQD